MPPSGPLDLVLAHPEMFFPDGQPRATMCVQQLLNEVLALGGTDARVQRVDGWWVFWSAFDWFTGIDPRVLFTTMQALPSTGGIGGRCEIVLAAFAESVATWGVDGGLAVKGGPPPPAVWEEMQRGARAIAFRFPPVV